MVPSVSASKSSLEPAQLPLPFRRKLAPPASTKTGESSHFFNSLSALPCSPEIPIWQQNISEEDLVHAMQCSGLMISRVERRSEPANRAWLKASPLLLRQVLPESREEHLISCCLRPSAQDPFTTSLLGKAAKKWQDRSKTMKAVREFLRLLRIAARASCGGRSRRSTRSCITVCYGCYGMLIMGSTLTL